jgi:hypothetical protein
MSVAIDARKHLEGLQGQTIHTFSGRPNTIIRVEKDEVIVATERSPKGTPVPIEWVQDGIDLLLQESEVEISAGTLGYRGAFVAAVLLTLPQTEKAVNPSRVRLRSSS